MLRLNIAEITDGSLSFTFRTMFRHEADSVIMPFRNYGLDLRGFYMAFSGDDYDRYVLSFTSKIEMFNALVVYLVEYVNGVSDVIFIKLARVAAKIFNQLTDNEKNQCMKLRKLFKRMLLKKFEDLQAINFKLLEICALIKADKPVYNESNYKNDCHNGPYLFLWVNLIEGMALDNNEASRYVIDKCRAKCDQYNSLAARISFAQESENNQSVATFIDSKKHFEYFEWYLHSEIKTISMQNVVDLKEKVIELLAKLDQCQRIAAKDSTKYREINHIDILCEKFNSQQSPLIWLFHDKDSDIDDVMKIEIIRKLANRRPYNSDRDEKNINIPSGNPSSSTVNVTSPLMHAIEGYQSLSVIRELLINGAEVNAHYHNGYHEINGFDNSWNYSCDRENLSALHLASRRGDPQIVQSLLDHGADVNSRTNFGETPLHRVANAECARLLIAAGANSAAVDEHGNTPLHYCCMASYESNKSYGLSELTQLISLFARQGIINRPNKLGYTALHYAQYMADREDHIRTVVRLLCEHGADVNLQTADKNASRDDVFRRHPRPGMTPLLCLYEGSLLFSAELDTQKKRLEIAKILIAHGARLDATDENGETVLIKAVKKHALVAVKYFLSLPGARELISFQASINHPTALHVAAYWAAIEDDYYFKNNFAYKILQLLLDNGADLSATFHFKQYSWGTLIGEYVLTPLEYARFAILSHRARKDSPALKLLIASETATKARSKAEIKQNPARLFTHEVKPDQSADHTQTMVANVINN